MLGQYPKNNPNCDIMDEAKPSLLYAMNVDLRILKLSFDDQNKISIFTYIKCSESVGEI